MVGMAPVTTCMARAHRLYSEPQLKNISYWSESATYIKCSTTVLRRANKFAKQNSKGY